MNPMHGNHALPPYFEVCSIGFNSHRPPPILMDDGENRCRFVPRSPGGGCPGRGLSGRELGAAGQHIDIDFTDTNNYDRSCLRVERHNSRLGWTQAFDRNQFDATHGGAESERLDIGHQHTCNTQRLRRTQRTTRPRTPCALGRNGKLDFLWGSCIHLPAVWGIFLAASDQRPSTQRKLQR